MDSLDAYVALLERLPAGVVAAAALGSFWLVRQLLTGALMTRRHHEELMSIQVTAHEDAVSAYKARGDALATELQRQREVLERVATLGQRMPPSKGGP